MPKLKNVWTIVAVSAGALMLFGYKKYNDAQEVLDKMSFGIANITNVGISFPNINFKANIIVDNNSNIDFGANLSSKISVREVRVFNASGVYIGKGVGSISSIDLPANTTVQLPKLTFIVDARKAFGEVSSNLGNYFNGNYDSLNYQIDVNVFGKTVTFGSLSITTNTTTTNERNSGHTE